MRRKRREMILRIPSRNWKVILTTLIHYCMMHWSRRMERNRRRMELILKEKPIHTGKTMTVIEKR
jgi:hypothetical protein